MLVSDPHKIKNKGSIFIEAAFAKPKEEVVRFNLIIDKDKWKSLNEAQTKAVLEQGLGKVSPNRVSGIFYNQASFQYQEPEFLNDFDYGNVLIEAHIPYCLHIPNQYEIEVISPDKPEESVLIIPFKIWTERANVPGEEPSDKIDFFGEDRVVYFNKSVITGPKWPIHPEKGWEQNYTGRNIEKMKDQNGTFRYTRLYIQFNYAVTKEVLKDKGDKKTKILLEEVREKALGAVNRLIDSYRFVAKEEYVQRLGALSVNMVYFINHNQGFYTSFPNIETAQINRSKIEIEEIEKMLESGQKPPLYELLLLDAQSSFDNKRYVLAVVQSFQALEILLEKTITDALKKRGDTDTHQIEYLDRLWRTKDRLKDALKELKTTSLREYNQTLWDKWCTSYDKTRNEVVHQGKEPTATEVKDMLEINAQVIEWLKSL